MKRELILLIIFLVSMLFVLSARADEVKLDLTVIAKIESSGCVDKVSKRPGDESYGCHQITPATLAEYNQMTRHSYTKGDLLDDDVSYAVADWYLHKRIPQMIRHFKKPVPLENILIAYNAGIAYVKNGKPTPAITKNYIEKYRRLCSKISLASL